MSQWGLHSRRASAAAAFALIVAGATSALAQDPDQRSTIARIREELADASDSLALLQREATNISQAKADRDNPMLHLELGFVAYRLGDLTGEKHHFDDAGSEFQWAADLKPEWPFPWYGLGLAELAIGESQGEALENIKQMLGKDYLSKAADAFGHAARIDPAFAEPVIDLARTAIRQRVRGRLEVARKALREAAQTAASGSEQLQLARGRVEREVGDADSAVAAFDRYLQVGGDSGTGLLEIARTEFLRQRPDAGAGAYYTAVVRPLSPEARASLRDDLAWIASPEELRAFDSLPGNGLEPWLRQFWGRRDTEDGRRLGERLTEHYRRYFYAIRNYHLVSVHRHYDITERYRSDQQQVDDRGVIYLRHGEPDARATYPERSVEPNESWLYHRPDGDRIFHFVARNDVQDFKLVESVADALGMRVAIALSGGASTGPAIGLFESRSALDPMYQRLASLSYSARANILGEERNRGREAIRTGTTTDSYLLKFKDELKPLLQELAVTGATGETRLLIPFAIPGGRLLPFTRNTSVVYPLEFRVIAQRGDGLVRTLDTVRTFSVGRRVEAKEQLSGLLQFAVPPGTYRLRVIVAQPGTDAGGQVQHDVVVPPLDATHPGISDLVVGHRGEGPVWVNRGDSIPVNALLAYPQGSTLALYYEVHGVPSGSHYHARIEVTRENGGGFLGLFGGKRTPVSLEFDGTSEGEPTRVTQTVNVGDLATGHYRLSVAVTPSGSDTHHTRVVSFAITPRRAG